jgi:polyribonucleotide nucleotidyltransferase
VQAILHPPQERLVLEGGRSDVIAVIGKGGETIAAIQQESGARLDIARDSNELVVAGQKAQCASASPPPSLTSVQWWCLVEADRCHRRRRRPAAPRIAAARKLIAQAIAAAQPEATERLEVASAAAVIGKGGATIRRIQEESGARLDIERRPQQGSGGPGKGDTIVITGGTAEVAAAAAAVGAILHPVYEAEEAVEAGKRVGAVVGPKGATVRALQEETGALIDIERDGSVVQIRGTAAAVAAAKAAVVLLVDPPSEVVVIGGEGDRDSVGTVIGKGGATIAAIQQESGARLDVDRKRGDQEGLRGRGGEVRVSGTPAQIEAAKALIEGALAAARPEATERLEVASAAAVIGKGGATIRRIQEESGARLDIERRPQQGSGGPGKGDTIVITGGTAEVAAAAAAVGAILHPVYEAEEAVEVGRRHVALVVGPKGATVRALQAQSGVAVIGATARPGPCPPPIVNHSARAVIVNHSARAVRRAGVCTLGARQTWRVVARRCS